VTSKPFVCHLLRDIYVIYSRIERGYETAICITRKGGGGGGWLDRWWPKPQLCNFLPGSKHLIMVIKNLANSFFALVRPIICT